MKVKELFSFIEERYRIYERRAAGQPKPWTKDPILQQYRFCNVHRENDAVTKWIADNWRTPNAQDTDLWFALSVARFVNWPDTLQVVGYPVPWNGQKFVKTLASRRLDGAKNFSMAYIVSTIGRQLPKEQYLAQCVLGPAWRARSRVSQTIAGAATLAAAYNALCTLYGFGDAEKGAFMAAQVIADLKFVQLTKASDWWTWAAPGPGSRRGLNRVLDRHPQEPWDAEEWLETLHTLQAKIDPLTREAKIPRISAQDLQNCMCEFDKYERARLLQGRPKQLYNGGAA